MFSLKCPVERTLHRSVVLAALLCGLTATDTVGQELSEGEQKQMIAVVFELTKVAKTAKEQTTFIEACESLLKKDLNENNRSYVKSLSAWGHNRRGESRLEVFESLQQAGNLEQADAALREACADFDKATQLDPQRARAWHFRGIANVQRSQFEDAIADFSKEIELKPHDVRAYFNRAEVYRCTGQPEPAIADYSQALEADSGDLEALTGRAHCHYAMANFDKALHDYDAIVQLSPENAMAIINRADAHQMLGQWQQAYDDYMSSVSIEPLGVGFQKWAWMTATCPEPKFLRPQEAIKLCQQAIELDGETPANLDTKAAAEAAMGNFEVAKQLQQRAIALAESKDKEMQARMAMYQQGQAYKQASAAENHRRTPSP